MTQPLSHQFALFLGEIQHLIIRSWIGKSRSVSLDFVSSPSRGALVWHSTIGLTRTLKSMRCGRVCQYYWLAHVHLGIKRSGQSFSVYGSILKQIFCVWTRWVLGKTIKLVNFIFSDPLAFFSTHLEHSLLILTLATWQLFAFGDI